MSDREPVKEVLGWRIVGVDSPLLVKFIQWDDNTVSFELYNDELEVEWDMSVELAPAVALTHYFNVAD